MSPDTLLPMDHSGASRHEIASSSKGDAAEAPINILIVDDEPRNLAVLETVLTDLPYHLIRAGSADEALLALIDDEFALLILDISMPGMSGFELAQMIKTRKKTAHVPIIFLTAFYNEDQHALEGYSTGAVDYLHKPVNPAILRSKVSVFADLYRKNREIGLTNRALVAEIEERRKIEEQLRNLNETLELQGNRSNRGIAQKRGNSPTARQFNAPNGLDSASRRPPGLLQCAVGGVHWFWRRNVRRN